MANVIAVVWKGGIVGPFRAVRLASVLHNMIAPKPAEVANKDVNLGNRFRAFAHGSICLDHLLPFRWPETWRSSHREAATLSKSFHAEMSEIGCVLGSSRPRR